MLSRLCFAFLFLFKLLHHQRQCRPLTYRCKKSAYLGRITFFIKGLFYFLRGFPLLGHVIHSLHQENLLGFMYFFFSDEYWSTIYNTSSSVLSGYKISSAKHERFYTLIKHMLRVLWMASKTTVLFTSHLSNRRAT